MTIKEELSKVQVHVAKLIEEAAITDWIMAFSTVCLLLVAIIAASISYYQWREMHTGGADTHELALEAKAQADATKAEADSMKDLADKSLRQAEATDKLAAQAEKSAAASIQSARDADISARATKDMAAISARSLEYAKESARLDQRAWLAVTSLRLTKFQADKRLEAQLLYTNSGRSPALRVSIVGVVLILDPKVRPDFLNLAPAEDFTALRSVAPQGVNNWTKPSERPLTEEEKDAIGRGTRIAWAWGFVRYEDMFGTSHITQFCGNTAVKGIESSPIQEGMELNLCPNQNGMN
jgi:hypothetical protein